MAYLSTVRTGSPAFVGCCLRSRHIFGLHFDHSIQICNSLEGKQQASVLEPRHSVGIAVAFQRFLCSFLGGARRTTVSIQALRLGAGPATWHVVLQRLLTKSIHVATLHKEFRTVSGLGDEKPVGLGAIKSTCLQGHGFRTQTPEAFHDCFDPRRPSSNKQINMKLQIEAARALYNPLPIKAVGAASAVSDCQQHHARDRDGERASDTCNTQSALSPQIHQQRKIRKLTSRTSAERGSRESVPAASFLLRPRRSVSPHQAHCFA